MRQGVVRSSDRDLLLAFPSEIGWMAVVARGQCLEELTFGHSSAGRAVAHLASPLTATDPPQGTWIEGLAERLQAYVAGVYDDFRDVKVDLRSLSAFQRQVIACCRRIPFGQTMTYGELAARAGFPRAARAVGRCMATNRIPLVIPCHRVVAADGSLCGYSASGGIGMKRRLLAMERSTIGQDCRS